MKRASARDTLPLPLLLPLAPPSMTPPSPRCDPSSQSFSRYRSARPRKLPPTVPSTLTLEAAFGHGTEQALGSRGHASGPIASTRQTLPSERHALSSATTRVHEFPRSPDANCSSPATRSGPTSQLDNGGRLIHTMPLDTQSDSIAGSPQPTGEREPRQQGYKGKARCEGRRLPASETKQTPGQDPLRRDDAVKGCQERLGEAQNTCATPGEDTQQIKKLEVPVREEHKPLGQKADSVQSSSSLRKNITESENGLLSSSNYDRSSIAQLASARKRGETLNKTVPAPVRVRLEGEGLVCGLDAPLSAVNAGERVCSILQQWNIRR